MGYKTKCLFFRDSDVVDEITWYPALPDAPLLGVATEFASLRHEPKDFFWLPGGEVPDEPFTKLRDATKPGALGVHHCGTDEDFREGCKYLPLDPPVLYRTDGLPHCCGAAPEVRGGGAGGGRVVVVVTNPVVPGADCDHASPVAADVPTLFSIPGAGIYWIRCAVGGATDVHTTVEDVLSSLTFSAENLFWGATCATSSGPFAYAPPGCQHNVTGVAVAFLWVNLFVSAGSGMVRITAGPGPC